MSDVTLDLNQTITSAVNARIEAEVVKAFSSDEVLGRFITAALQQTVEVAGNGPYDKKKVPFLTSVLQRAIQDATKAAVAKFLVEEAENIEDAVRKALRRDISAIAQELTKSLVRVAERPYGVSVSVDLKIPSGS